MDGDHRRRRSTGLESGASASEYR